MSMLAIGLWKFVNIAFTIVPIALSGPSETLTLPTE